MNLKEYLKDKNVLTIDIWAAFLTSLLVFYGTYLIKVPEIQPDKIPTISTEIGSIMIIDLSGIIIFTTIGLIMILMCSKLRKYRYFDIYLQCKKANAKLMKIIANIIFFLEFIAICFCLWLVLSTTPALIVIYMSIYALISLSILILLSIRFNNSKDLK